MNDATTGVSVIIPNLNGAHYLGPCLTSVFEQGLAPVELEVVLIDNASADGSVDLVRRQFPTVRIISNSRNLGFTLAVNQGLEAATRSLILLLNNDTVMQSGSLSALCAALSGTSSDVVGVQPLLLWAGNPEIVDSAGIALARRFRAFDHLHGHPLSEAPSETKEIWGTCFGCALIRKEAFEQCGPLDPDFFAEWDDVDFSLRTRWHGWKFLLIPEARVLHHRSPTSNRDPQAKLVRLRRNQMLTYTKDLPLSMALVRLGYRFQYDLSMSLHYFRHGELSGVWQSWREWFAFLPRMLARRKQVRRTARLSSREMKQQIRSFTHGA